MCDTESAPDLAGFLDISALLTGFSVPELQETGLSRRYLDTMVDRIGVGGYRRFRTAFADTAPEQVTDDVALELARALIWLWYLGVWPELPAETCAALGIGGGNVAQTVSPRAYAEGLVWKTIGTAAPGTAAAGHGSWSRPPRTTSVPSRMVAALPWESRR